MLKMHKHKMTGVVFVTYENNEGEITIFHTSIDWKGTPERLNKLESIETDSMELLRIVTKYCEKNPYGTLTKEIKPWIPTLTYYIWGVVRVSIIVTNHAINRLMGGRFESSAVNRNKAISIAKHILKRGRIISIQKDGNIIYEYGGKTAVVGMNNKGDQIVITILKSNKYMA